MNYVRLVLMSDTHGRQCKVPDGDILVYAGDMCPGRGTLEQVEMFGNWIDRLDFSAKVVIPGNHDLPFERCPEDAIDRLPGDVDCLISEGVTRLGVKFWGEPRTPRYGNSWAFQADNRQCREMWKAVPDDTNVLISHGPPQGCLDSNRRGEPCGDGWLTEYLLRNPVTLAVCGHIHEAPGQSVVGSVYVVNACICDLWYNPVNKPVVYDIFV